MTFRSPRRQAALDCLSTRLARAARTLPHAGGAGRSQQGALAGTAVIGTGLLRAALSGPPASGRFYALSLASAATWIGGGLAATPAPATTPNRDDNLGVGPGAARIVRSILTPLALGATAFGVFYSAARIARHIPPLNAAIADVLRHSHRGWDPLVLLTTLANGVGEEVFFRGALYTTSEGSRPGAMSTAAYVATTAATGNPALTLAATAMGALFAAERRATGGITAPLLTHLSWSGLMLRYLPPLFEHTLDADRPAAE